jgi:hypothetical protein
VGSAHFVGPILGGGDPEDGGAAGKAPVPPLPTAATTLSLHPKTPVGPSSGGTTHLFIDSDVGGRWLAGATSGRPGAGNRTAAVPAPPGAHFSAALGA